MAASSLLERASRLSESTLYAAPDEQTWSAIKILSHIAEFVPYWAAQARTVASSSSTEVFGRTHDDRDRIAAVEDHASDTLGMAITRLQVALVAADKTLRSIPADGWARRGRHARRGEMTAAAIIDSFILDHLEEHSRQLEEVLASVGRTVPKAAPS